MLLAAAAGLAACASPEPPALFAVSKRQPPSLVKLDLATRQVAGRAALGVNGHEVAISADGRLAYVPIYGDGAVGRPGTDGSTIEVYDTASLKRVDTIDLGEAVRPHSIIERNGLLWVTAEKAEAVLIVDPKAKRIVGRAPTGQPEAHSLALSPDGRRLYTANVGAGSVSIIDAVERKLLAVVPVARRVQRVTLSPDGRMVFTHDTEKPRIAVIDPTTQKLARWIELPDAGYASATTSDGRLLVVGSPVKRRVHIVDLRTLAVTRTIDPNCDPAHVTLSRDDRRAFLSCPRDGKVAVLNLATMTMEPPLPVEPGIEGIALAE